MVDVVDAATRSRMMSGIRGGNTKPERVLRLGLHRLGLRYRLHGGSAALPGRPDLIFPKYRAAVLIHGCFWHGHDCHLFRWPATRPEFWRQKIASNTERDARQIAALRADGWRVAVVWECALKGAGANVPDVCDSVAEWIRHGDSTLELRG
ncbi:MAG: DNA mismatch endonuclease Vsr [Burkholderiaceae bacterium]|nr:DNA mismatch endonuclease Vsr [Burkholderiaceae bacterium]